MEPDNERVRKDLVRILAKAASDQEFFERLRADPKKILEEEGIKGEEFLLRDATVLKSVIAILEALGNILYKRS
jgi:hypothetical protein